MGLNDLNKKLKTLREEIKKMSEQEFSKYLQEYVFSKMPQLESVGWKQYANYFCDGDPCSFYVHDYTLEFNEMYIEEDEESLMKLEGYEDAKTAMQEFLFDIDSEIFEMTFGPDQHIVIHRNGKIENNEYGTHS
jgi:hypothetical protein